MSEVALNLIEEARKIRAKALDLGNCGLTEVPEELFELEWLETLVLGPYYIEYNVETGNRKELNSKNGGPKNNLNSLGKGWKLMSCLRNLSLEENQISDLSPLAQLSNLQSLDCWQNQISDLSPLAQLSNLKFLYCSYNQISDLSPLAQLSNLQSLDCSSNQISDLPPLAQLSNLQSLYCSSNPISDLSPLAQLSNLQSLDCLQNQISDLSPLAQLSNLKFLYCSYNQISDLSPLAQLSNLQSLNCSSNHISDLSPLAQLSNLQSLDCSSNQISDLSPLAQLSNLQSLDCLQNQISDLSPLAQLRNLQSLNCSFNQISDLSPLAQLRNLQSLNCSFNQISDLSPLAQLSNLQSLNCSSNQISDLSPLAQLSNLKFLYCSSNQISDLSPLAQLSNLQSLNCRQNQISDLSPLSQLSNLKSLNCSSNQISDLSPLAQLDNLRSLNFENNPVTNLEPLLPHIKRGRRVSLNRYASGISLANCPITIPPIEIVKKGNQVILQWFAEREHAHKQGGTVRLLEAKCLILGEGGAGKTTLARKLLNPEASMPRGEETTKGIDVHALELPLEDGRTILLNLWDFGGQEIYHSTHQFFLTKRSLYILVDDTRKDDRTLHDPVFNYWLQVVELYGGGSPLLIVQNEKDNRSKGIDLEGMKGRFDFIKKSLASNLATNRGLPEIRQAIRECVQNLPHIGEEQPRAWLEIRQALGQLKGEEGRDYISLETYLNICKAHRIQERERALFLSAYLHDLGIFLHFQDDPVLQHMLILNNAWATAAVYRLLDDEPIKQLNGRFTQKDFQRIWHEPQYAGLHMELLALMARFELCYKLPGQGEDAWLATQLLPVARPVQLDWPAKPDRHFRFEYVFMPKGLLSKHIVRMNKLVKDPTLAWRTGVLLEHEGTKALVTETYGGREIRVQAMGKKSDELLLQIYQDFLDMHERFDGLKVKTWVPCNCKTCTALAEPHFYDLEDLKMRSLKGKHSIECRNSYEDVNVLQLLADLFFFKGLSNFDTNFYKNLIDDFPIKDSWDKNLDDLNIKQSNLRIEIDYIKKIFQEKTMRLEPKIDKK